MTDSRSGYDEQLPWLEAVDDEDGPRGVPARRSDDRVRQGARPRDRRILAPAVHHDHFGAARAQRRQCAERRVDTVGFVEAGYDYRKHGASTG